jgi:hypothetical protein
VRFMEHRSSTLAYGFVSHGAREIVLVSIGCLHDLYQMYFEGGGQWKPGAGSRFARCPLMR